MDNKYSLDLCKMNSDITKKKNKNEYFGLKHTHNLSKSLINDNSYKYFIHNKKNFLKNKRKKSKNENRDAPHNTGQYLCHIHRSPDFKINPMEKDDEINNIGLNFFEEDENFDEDDLDFDLMPVEDKKRDRLMSVEGKDIESFLFSNNETKEEKNITKSALLLGETKDNLNI